MTQLQTEQGIVKVPAGTWKVDPAHSSVGFEVKHMMISTVRGHFSSFDGRLEADEDPERSQVTGWVDVASINTGSPDRDAHLRSPDFFDAEQHPELRFTATSIERNGDEVTIDGEITLRGVTKPVTIGGTVVGPTPDAYGNQRLAFDVETTVDRRDFGINWNLELPNGVPALGNDVKITANLALVQA